MPQTVEHLSILDLLGTRTGVIALTKCDLVDEDWLLLVTADVKDAVHGHAAGGCAHRSHLGREGHRHRRPPLRTRCGDQVHPGS
jgi:hypothetical protein